MINNKDNIDNDNDNTIWNVFIGLFSVLLIVEIVCFCMFAYFKWFKSEYTNNTIYTYEKR